MFILSIAFLLSVDHVIATNDSNFNYSYYVSGDMTLYSFNSSLIVVESAHVTQVNGSNATNVTNVSYNDTIHIISNGTISLSSSFNPDGIYWYENIATISGPPVKYGCFVAYGGTQTSCVFDKTLHQYGIPVREAEFWFIPFGDNHNGYHRGVRLTFFDGNQQWYGDITGNPTNTYTFALGETLNTLQLVWVQMTHYFPYGCGFLKKCWANPIVLGWVAWTTNLGTFGAGEGVNGAYQTENYDVAGKFLAGFVFAPRDAAPHNDREDLLYISGVHIYLFNKVTSVDVQDVAYLGLDAYTQGLVPKDLVQWVVCNDAKGEITLTRSFSEENGNKHCWTDQRSTMYGLSATITAGVPEIGFDVSETAKWESTQTNTYQRCENTVTTVTTSIAKTFAPLTETTVHFTQYQSTITIPYTAKIFLGVFGLPKQELITVTGQYTGIYVSSTLVNSKPINISDCPDLGGENPDINAVQQTFILNSSIIAFVFFIISV